MLLIQSPLNCCKTLLDCVQHIKQGCAIYMSASRCFVASFNCIWFEKAKFKSVQKLRQNNHLLTQQSINPFFIWYKKILSSNHFVMRTKTTQRAKEKVQMCRIWPADRTLSTPAWRKKASKRKMSLKDLRWIREGEKLVFEKVEKE